MRMTCPACQSDFPVEAGFADADGKRLAALFAGMDPALGRSVMCYLRLFRPGQQNLRTARAIRIVSDLMDLMESGMVCRDERGGVCRPAYAGAWGEGIEQMLANTAKLVLPLANHNYLRTIVFGLADSADAAAERQREEQARVGADRQPASASADGHRQGWLHGELAWLKRMHEYGQMSLEEYQDKVAETRQRFQEPST